MKSEIDTHHGLGVTYVASSAFHWSLSGVLMRLIESDLTTTLFYRGVLSGFTILAVLVSRDGWSGFSVKSIARLPTLVVSVLMVVCMLAALGAMHYTSIAECMTIFAVSPFLTAAFAFFMIGERPSATTIVASLVAFGGVLYMVSESQGAGTGLGRALAVAFTIATSLMSTMIRQHREVEMLPSMVVSSWLCALVVAPFATFTVAAPTDVFYIIVFGIVQSGLAQTAYTIGVRYIPAAEASLLVALEVPLSPLLVWLVVNEVPTRSTQIGGAIALLALFSHMAIEFRSSRR